MKIMNFIALEQKIVGLEKDIGGLEVGEES
jgi:hypothetical protein